jgi:hypothetical protein
MRWPQVMTLGFFFLALGATGVLLWQEVYRAVGVLVALDVLLGWVVFLDFRNRR